MSRYEMIVVFHEFMCSRIGVTPKDRIDFHDSTSGYQETMTKTFDYTVVRWILRLLVAF